MEWLLIIAVAAFFVWRYREKLFPPKNPGVASGFDPHKPGVTVQDIIRAYHVDPPKPSRPQIFLGSWAILNGLALAGLAMIVSAIAAGLPAPAVFGLVFVAAAAIYWFFNGGSSWISRSRSPKTETPVASKKFSTPAETQAAINQIRLAYAILQKEAASGYEDRPEKVAARLAPASVALNRARALDPNATATFDQKDGKFTYTVDSLAARLLYCEAFIYEQVVQKAQAQGMPEDFLKEGVDATESLKTWKHERDYMLKRYRPAALVAAEKAVLYEPRNTQYLRMLAVCYRHSNLSQAADAILQHALQLDPNDIETLGLLQ